MQDYDSIETPENVVLHRPLAGIGTRLIAGLLDALVLAGILLVLVIIGLFAGITAWGLFSQSGVWALALAIALFYAVYWGYFVFFELWLNGQSPGKRWQKIRVVKEDGSPLTFTACAIRNLLRVVDSFGGYAVGGFVMFLTSKSQRLGDLAAGTVVVNEAVQDYSAKDKPSGIDWSSEPGPELLRATGLSPHDLQVLMNYWHRRDQLTAAARTRLLETLVGPILVPSGKADAAGDANQIEWQLAQILEGPPPGPPMMAPVAPSPSAQQGGAP